MTVSLLRSFYFAFRKVKMDGYPHSSTKRNILFDDGIVRIYEYIC